MSFQNLDFLNANSLRSYPIEEGRSRASIDGLFVIPDDFIVDLTLCISDDATQTFFISRISYLGSSAIIEVSNVSGPDIVGTFEITLAEHTTYKNYVMSSNVEGATGRIVIGALTGLNSQPVGAFSFDSESTLLEMRVASLASDSLTYLGIADKDGNTYYFGNKVKLVARSNLRFTVDEETDTIFLDAGEGLGLNEACSPLSFIRTINGVAPDVTGNFTLIPADCASLTPLSSGGGLLWSDKCCKPCMACDEVNQLVERLMQLETDILNLRNHYKSLETMSQEFATLLGYSCEC